MKALICPNCGGDEFIEIDGYRVCRYCKSKLLISQDEKPTKSASIALNDDVQALLDKCRKDPARAQRYANLILEIEPDNEEALNILYK